MVVHPEKVAEMFARKEKLLQAQAVSTAHQVLCYLRVNMDIDQYDLLGHMAENDWPEPNLRIAGPVPPPPAW